jgi:pSer/pThr/pTyr-binding forkhead associated (FHA) protein
VCRYDFVAGNPGPPPKAAPPAPTVQRWELLVQVDAALDTEPDPGTPFVAAPDRVVAIDRAETLIGRNDGPRDIHPELALADPGASRRHAKIVFAPDGRLTLQDLASTNGTQVNGADVKPGVLQPLSEGDAIRVGRWTRLVVRGRP